MDEYVFPKATEDLLVIVHKSGNPAQAIDEYLQKFSKKCARSFLDSLAPGLFEDSELLDRMRERQQ